jgi:hypothetical protein
MFCRKLVGNMADKLGKEFALAENGKEAVLTY